MTNIHGLMMGEAPSMLSGAKKSITKVQKQKVTRWQKSSPPPPPPPPPSSSSSVRYRFPPYRSSHIRDM